MAEYKYKSVYEKLKNSLKCLKMLLKMLQLVIYEVHHIVCFNTLINQNC